MSLQHIFRPMLMGILTLLLAATLLPSGGVVRTPVRAALLPQSNSVGIHLAGVPTRAGVLTAVHYIYADDGRCPDTIDGYQITSNRLVPTPGSPYSAGSTSCTDITVFGYNTLAVTQANSVHGPCLVHSDVVQPQVESFTINPATGALALASTVSALSSNPSEEAKDIRIANNGNLVYVSVNPGVGNAPGNLSSLALGAGCILKFDHQLKVPTKIYPSILLISASRLVAIDGARQGIDTYALTPTGGITFVNSVSGQFSETDGVADQTFASSAGQQITELYTGQFQLSSMFGSTAQAGQYTPSTGAFTPLATSPSTDLGGISLDYLLFNTAHHYLIGTETFSASVGIWSAAGSAFSLIGHVRLPEAGSNSEATTMAQLGTQLFVIGDNGSSPGEINRCTITSAAPGVKNCAIVATLSGTTGAAEGVAIL